MAEPLSDKARHIKIMRLFERIDKFLKDNSKKFYQEYDTHNATLEQVREQLKVQAKEFQDMAGADNEIVREIRAVLEIDAADGVANRLNMITISLAHLASPLLFNEHIKKRLPMDDLTDFSLRKIPWEVDAVFFITNPLLIFDLINDFLKYRTQQSHFTYMYITNRVTRLLFRFTKFVMEYEDFNKMIQLTFLNSKRFNPLAKTIKNVVQTLCLEAKENLLDLTKPIFMNDLRRLYIILAQTLFTLSTNKQHPHPVLKELLMALAPVLSIDEDVLREDGLYDEFFKYHFTSPQLKDYYSEQYEKLQELDIEYTLELLGYLHPTDRFIILKNQYQHSKSYVLGLFAKIREYYQEHSESLLLHYKNVANTIREIVDYAETQKDQFVDQVLIEELFFKKMLSLDKFPSSTESETDDLALENIKETPFKRTSEQSLVFKNFQKKDKDAISKNDVLELAEMPFCFLTIEEGKPYFSSFTLGEVVSLYMADRAYDDLIEYLLNTEQITHDEKRVVIAQLPKIDALMNQIVNKKQVGQIQMYDEQNRLSFYEFKQALQGLRNKIQTLSPKFLRLKNYNQFILDTLSKIEQILAKEQGVLPEELAPKWIPYFIDSEWIDNFISLMKESLEGYRHPKKVEQTLMDTEVFKDNLTANHHIKQKILDYERTRILKTIEPVAATPVSDTSPLSKEEDKLVEPFLIPFFSRESTFEELKNKREVQDSFLFELARMPFRYVEYAYGKTRFIYFTLTDTVIMSMDGKTRNFFIEFIRVTQQLTEEELSILKTHMVRLLFFLQRICQKLKRGQVPQGTWVVDNKINFVGFSQGLAVSDHKIRKDLRPLIKFKDQMQIFLEMVTETERMIAREKNKAVPDLLAHQIIDALKDINMAPKIIQSLKESAFGRKHLEDLVITSQSINSFTLHIINEYELSVRLFKYYEQYQKNEKK